jgi:O-methyltransferase
VIVFDDWFCFYGDPDRGERRAWAEFCQANPDLRFLNYISTNEAQAFICLGERKVPQEIGDTKPPTIIAS